ncbi:hypothetical protein BVG16_09355 [Paenibacillus selenitireducens]|uniref:Uncharacterized protein n=1 Tax=Paenibacillus selenitireducens TaxID=1324314 RepID=A0A1T2XHC6_9BACL|nr:hypothetical protein [Paenibacillus selenitireducens]OPA79284.1 hypothetical protein BVG16_09355 [Paenibacillus selenitireducens]
MDVLNKKGNRMPRNFILVILHKGVIYNMVKRKKFLLAGISICLTLILSVGVAAANWDNILQKYLAKDEVALQNDVENMSNEQLIDEIDTLAATVDQPALNSSSGKSNINILIPFVSELFQRKDELKDVDILSIIADNSKTDITHESLVDLYALKHEASKDGTEIKQLLLQDEISTRVKSRIVSTANFTIEDVELLKELIQKDDGILAFNSLKRLSRIDGAESYRLSESILSNIENESNTTISAALKATANYLKDSNQSAIQKNTNLEADFINVSLKIINTSNDPILKDSAFFAISEIGSQNAITQIIESDSVENQLKTYAIDQNFLTLKEMLTSNPTEDEIRTVLTALELLPIVDLLDPLKNVISNISDPDLKQRSEEVILLIKNEGINGNYKWVK